jgi:hypothetical protein
MGKAGQKIEKIPAPAQKKGRLRQKNASKLSPAATSSGNRRGVFKALPEIGIRHGRK